MSRSKYKIVSWSPAFSVGIKVIDDQHRELINLVNDLFSHITGDLDAEQAYFSKIIGPAVKQLKLHFNTEEIIMTHTNFPGYLEHKKTHDAFIFGAVERIKNYKTNKKNSLYLFTSYLKDWVLEHIGIMDKQYSIYFKHIATIPRSNCLPVAARHRPIRHQERGNASARLN